MSEKELAEATGAALRPSGLQALELVIGTEIQIANLSQEPLQKIRHVIEAFMLLPEEKRKDIATQEEIAQYERMHTLAISFLNTQMLPSGSHDLNRYASVPLTFAGEQAYNYLSPFIHLFFWPTDISKEAKQRVLTGVKESKERYFEWLSNIIHAGYFLQSVLSIKVQFIAWAMPKTANLSNLITTKFLSPETWEKVLFSTMGKGGKRGSSEAGAEILAS